MSILASKGISTPTFQPAAGKGNDSQGNGSGGMFMGGGGQQDEGYNPYDFDFGNYYPEDNDPQPFHVPLFGPKPDAMKLWKIVVANQLYEKILLDKALAAAAN